MTESSEAKLGKESYVMWPPEGGSWVGLFCWRARQKGKVMSKDLFFKDFNDEKMRLNGWLFEGVGRCQFHNAKKVIAMLVVFFLSLHLVGCELVDDIAFGHLSGKESEGWYYYQ